MRDETNAESLHPSVEPERVERVWKRIESTRGAPRRSGTKESKAKSGFVLALVAAASLLAVWRSTAPSRAHAVTFRDGAALDDELIGPARLGFSDGSWLTLSETARLLPVNNDGEVVELVQRSGRVRYSVEGQGRHWRIDAGRASVEIVGTEFVVERSEARIRVEVDEGVVLVRSEQLEDGVARLTAGEVVELRSPHFAAPESGRVDQVAAEEAPAESPIEIEALDESASQGESASHDESRAEQPASSALQEPRRSADLMNAADAARRQGRREDAERLLEEAIALDDGDSDLAALTLARSLEHTAPARASRLFERALELGLAEPMRRGALRGFAETTEAAGGNATAVWRRFYERYPDEPVQVLP